MTSNASCTRLSPASLERRVACLGLPSGGTSLTVAILPTSHELSCSGSDIEAYSPVQTLVSATAHVLVANYCNRWATNANYSTASYSVSHVRVRLRTGIICNEHMSALCDLRGAGGTNVTTPS